jgi:putative flippase GtrA
LSKTYSWATRAKAWAIEHRTLIISYAIVGTVAWAVSIMIQTALVEGVDAGSLIAYLLQFLPVQVIYYSLIRRYVIQGNHYHWRRNFHRLLAVKTLQLASGAGLYQLLLLKLPYLAALVFTSAALTVPFFMLTKDGAFRKSLVVDAKAKA